MNEKEMAEKRRAKYQAILKKIAEENNTTPEDVEREMQVAIDAAYENPDDKAKWYQEQVPCKGERPTPEELIFTITKMLRTDTYGKKERP